MNSPLLALASATMVAVTAYAGGWATVTVKHIPEYLVVGKPAELRLLVRQHGVSPSMDRQFTFVRWRQGESRRGQSPGLSREPKVSTPRY